MNKVSVHVLPDCKTYFFSNFSVSNNGGEILEIKKVKNLRLLRAMNKTNDLRYKRYKNTL